MERFLLVRQFLFAREVEMKRSVFAILAVLLLMLVITAVPLMPGSPPSVRIMGIPKNGNLTKSKVCPPGVLPCDDDCQWNLTFSAEITADNGISSTEGRVDSDNQPVTNDPPLTPCGGSPVKRTVTSFTRDFAVSCPGVQNGCTTEIFAIDFGVYDCASQADFAYMRLYLKCYYCSNDAWSAVDGNGTTGVSYAEYDRSVGIQFVVLNLRETAITVNLTSLETQPWPFDPAFPSSIELESGESREFFVDVTVPAGILPGTENIFTLNAEAGDGLWISASDTIFVNEITSIDRETVVPAALHLSQNYPNPFNPTTRIAFDLNVSGSVELAIYDMSGRKVAVLIDGALEAGRHEAFWNGMTSEGREVPSGVYFCRLVTSTESISRKLVLLR
jgi:hypothetical protein